jgi:riboflavin biosynthesis pyrimidine reductase
MIQADQGLAKKAQATSIESLAQCYGVWEGVRSNHVIDRAGAFAGSDGSSRSLSTKEDRDLLIELRARADLIVVDAATARIESYRSPSSGAKLAIFSAGGDFSGIPAVENPEEFIYLFSPSAIAAPGQLNLKPNLTQSNPFIGFLDWAMENGFSSVLLEAGPTLTSMAFELGIVKESALTVTPRILGSDNQAIRHPFDANSQLVSLAHSADASFTLWTH